jgi:two-component system, OmpR family, alkaline phosphatase synthesis response regulator PhoP
MAVRPPTRILVAEDDPDIGSLLEHYLKKAGFLPTIVSSGRDVMPQIKRDTPDLVVLDLMLPGLDGLQLCRAIRADAATALIPVIMLTAKAEESDRIVGLELAPTRSWRASGRCCAARIALRPLTAACHTAA